MRTKNVLIIIISGILCAYNILGLNKNSFAQPLTGKCGDDICDDFERTRSNLCPQDCAPEKSTESSGSQKPPAAPIGRCGDNICDNFEKANPDACPEDCGGVNTEVVESKGLYQCPQYIPPASSFYENCQKQGGTVTPGGKDDKGCQSPPRCVLSAGSGETMKGSKTANKDSPFGFVQGSFDTNYKFDPTYKNMLDLGVHWDRPFEGHTKTMWLDIENEKTGKGNYDFRESDAILSEAFKKDVNLFISLPIINPLYGSDVSRDGYPYPTHPDALEGYKKFVKEIVRRYSNRVKYWMVGQNEFDDLNPLAKNLKAYSKEGFNNMVQYVKAACEAIAQVCADCRPVIGGSVVPAISFSKKGDKNPAPDGNGYQEVAGDGLYARLIPLVRESRADLVIDYHFWYKSDKKDYKNQREIIDKIRKIAPGAEIWNTETGTVDGINGATEFEQARDIVRLYVYALAYGQKKLFWTNTIEYDWTKDDSSAFDYMGLINNPGNTDGLSHKKLSYYTYKKMVEVLEGSDWDNIQIIQEKDGVYVYKFIKNALPVWVAWNDNEAEKQVIVSGMQSKQARITEAVPKRESGKDVTDYKGAFNAKSEKIRNGKITLTIKDIPIFIIEETANSELTPEVSRDNVY